MHHTTVEYILLALIPIVGTAVTSFILKTKRIPVRIKAEEQHYPDSRFL